MAVTAARARGARPPSQAVDRARDMAVSSTLLLGPSFPSPLVSSLAMFFQKSCHLAITWRVFLPPMPKCTGGTSNGLCGVLQRLAGTQLGNHGLLDPTNSCFTSDLKLFTEGGVGVLPLPECPFTDTMPSCCFRTMIALPDIMDNGGLQPSSAGTSLRYGCLLPYHLIRLNAQCAISSVDILCPND